MIFFNKNILIPIFLSNVFLLSQLSHASFDIQSGKVGMNGEILESACTIDLNSLYQTVDMGNIPIVSVIKEQDVNSVEFEIRLIDCRWGSDTKSNLTSLDISFTGKSEDNHFWVEGDATGVYLGLESISGKMIFPGEIFQLENDFSHQNRSKYKLKLISSGQIPTPGSFDTLIQFNIRYK